MEVPTHCSDSVISETNHVNQGSGAVIPQPAQPHHKGPFSGDTSNAGLGQNGRDFVLQEVSSVRHIENADQSYTVRLQARGMQ